MKKTKTSARVATDWNEIRPQISSEIHTGLMMFAHRHGLTCSQAVNFILNWAVTKGMITPADMRPEDYNRDDDDDQGDEWKGINA